MPTGLNTEHHAGCVLECPAGSDARVDSKGAGMQVKLDLLGLAFLDHAQALGQALSVFFADLPNHADKVTAERASALALGHACGRLGDRPDRRISSHTAHIFKELPIPRSIDRSVFCLVFLCVILLCQRNRFTLQLEAMSSDEESVNHECDHEEQEEYEQESVMGYGSVAGDSRKKDPKITEAIVITPVMVEPEIYTEWQEVDKGLHCKFVKAVMTYWNTEFSSTDQSALSVLGAFPSGLVKFFKNAGNDYSIVLVTYTKLNMSNENGMQNTNMLKGLALARTMDINGKKMVELAPGTICKTKETPENPKRFNPIKPLAWVAFDPEVFPMACYIKGMGQKIIDGEKVEKEDLQSIVDFLGEDFLKDKKKAYTKLSCDVSMGYYTSPYKLKAKTGDTEGKDVTFYTALAYNNKNMTPLIEMGYRQVLKMKFVSFDETEEMAKKAAESIKKIMNTKALIQVGSKTPTRNKRSRRALTEAHQSDDEEARPAKVGASKTIDVHDNDSGVYQGIARIIMHTLEYECEGLGAAGQPEEAMKAILAKTKYTFEKHPLMEYAENLDGDDLSIVKNDFATAVAMILTEYEQQASINCSYTTEEFLVDMPKIKELFKATDRGLKNLAKICYFAETMAMRIVPESKTFTAICIVRAAELMKATAYVMVTKQWDIIHPTVCRILDIQNPKVRGEIKTAHVISLVFSISYMLIKRIERKRIDLDSFKIPEAFKEVVTVQSDFPFLPERHRLYASIDNSITNKIPDYIQKKGGFNIIEYCRSRIHRISFAAHKEMKLDSTYSTSKDEFAPEYFVFFAGISHGDEGIKFIPVIEYLYLGAWFEQPIFRFEMPTGRARFHRSLLQGVTDNINNSIRHWVENNFHDTSINRSIPINHESQKALKTMLLDISVDIAFNAQSIMDPDCKVYTGHLPEDVQGLIKGDSNFKGTEDDVFEDFHPKFIEFLKKLGACKSMENEFDDFQDEETKGFFFLTTIPLYVYSRENKSIWMARIAPLLIEDTKDVNFTKQITMNPRYLHLNIGGPIRTEEEDYIKLTPSEIARVDPGAADEQDPDNPSDEDSD